MKKFVGLVNGKSFDNEKDLNDAANKAIKEKLKTIGKKIDHLQLKDSLGIWSFSSYFITDTQTS